MGPKCYEEGVRTKSRNRKKARVARDIAREVEGAARCCQRLAGRQNAHLGRNF